MNEKKKNYFQQNGFFIFWELFADEELTALHEEAHQAIHKGDRASQTRALPTF